MKQLSAAIKYLRKGLSVIPLEGKCPRISWKAYQGHLPTEDEAREWWSKWPKADIGIICGGVSGSLAVLDIDDVELAKQLLKSDIIKGVWVSQTPRGGLHIYLRESRSPTSTSGPLVPGVADLKAEGGYVVAPPSPGYKWVKQ